MYVCIYIYIYIYKHVDAKPVYFTPERLSSGRRARSLEQHIFSYVLFSLVCLCIFYSPYCFFLFLLCGFLFVYFSPERFSSGRRTNIPRACFFLSFSLNLLLVKLVKPLNFRISTRTTLASLARVPRNLRAIKGLNGSVRVSAQDPSSSPFSRRPVPAVGFGRIKKVGYQTVGSYFLMSFSVFPFLSCFIKQHNCPFVKDDLAI